MALTLADQALQSNDAIEQGYVKVFIERSPLMRMTPFKKIRGDAYTYRQELALPGIQWRRVNEDYLESTGSLTKLVEPLMIIGGEIFQDTFLQRTSASGPDAIDLWTAQHEMKARALAREWSRAFIYGDWLIDPDEMEGVRRRATGTQVLVAAAGGGPLTLTLMDEMVDNTNGDNRIILMNKILRRKATTLARAAGTSITVTYTSIDDVGEQISSYEGIPIHIVEDLGNGSTMLGFTEDPGDGTPDTASMYCINLDEDEGVHAIYNGDGPIVAVRDLGEDQDSPGRKGRIEMFCGLVVKNNRALTRVRALTAA